MHISHEIYIFAKFSKILNNFMHLPPISSIFLHHPQPWPVLVTIHPPWPAPMVSIYPCRRFQGPNVKGSVREFNRSGKDCQDQRGWIRSCDKAPQIAEATIQEVGGQCCRFREEWNKEEQKEDNADGGKRILSGKQEGTQQEAEGRMITGRRQYQKEEWPRRQQWKQRQDIRDNKQSIVKFLGSRGNL